MWELSEFGKRKEKRELEYESLEEIANKESLDRVRDELELSEEEYKKILQELDEPIRRFQPVSFDEEELEREVPPEHPRSHNPFSLTNELYVESHPEYKLFNSSSSSTKDPKKESPPKHRRSHDPFSLTNELAGEIRSEFDYDSKELYLSPVSIAEVMYVYKCLKTPPEESYKFLLRLTDHREFLSQPSLLPNSVSMTSGSDQELSVLLQHIKLGGSIGEKRFQEDPLSYFSWITDFQQIIKEKKANATGITLLSIAYKRKMGIYSRFDISYDYKPLFQVLVKSGWLNKSAGVIRRTAGEDFHVNHTDTVSAQPNFDHYYREVLRTFVGYSMELDRYRRDLQEFIRKIKDL